VKNIAFGFVVGFAGLCATLLLYGFYHDYWSPEAKRGFQNERNVSRVKLGMTMPEVAALMGQPITVGQSNTCPPQTQHTYQMPPGSSRHCAVAFDHSGRVAYVSKLAE
jgi:hypothetical protein